jgi:hypothetical protein
MGSGLELIKYRDAGMHTYTYFWTKNSKTISPFFDTEIDAIKWLKTYDWHDNEKEKQ